jgi:hypothetical protein
MKRSVFLTDKPYEIPGIVFGALTLLGNVGRVSVLRGPGYRIPAFIKMLPESIRQDTVL